MAEYEVTIIFEESENISEEQFIDHVGEACGGIGAEVVEVFKSPVDPPEYKAETASTGIWPIEGLNPDTIPSLQIGDIEITFNELNSSQFRIVGQLINNVHFYECSGGGWKQTSMKSFLQSGCGITYYLCDDGSVETFVNKTVGTWRKKCPVGTPQELG